ncbi:MAG: dienelactone hydrolase family protein [Immundisolibacterales bacterium]|nr:dienelactone hydrolase family protein [Immundisolibacterales bacterium]
MGQTIELTASDGHKLAAYRADPAGAPRAGVVVIQEIFGVNAHIREVADDYAAQGYLAIAPALFDRSRPGVELGYDENAIAAGRDLAFAMEPGLPVLDLEAAVGVAASAGKVGVVGYCWGGSLTFLAACKLGVAAASSYYGGQIVAALEREPSLAPGAPLIMHFGEHDAGIPLADVDRIRKSFPEVPIHMYDAGHGFNCDHRGSYDETSSRTARERTLDLFASHLAS